MRAPSGSRWSSIGSCSISSGSPLHFSEITDGAFDITYASVGYLYDYRKHVKPTEGQIKAALPGVNWHNLLLDEKRHSVRFEHEGMRIDLGGIAKGYAVDRGIGILQIARRKARGGHGRW